MGVPDPRRGDRDEVLQGLLLAVSRLNEVRSARDRFFRRAVHDLSGPLTALGGYCGLLLDQRLGQLNQQQLDVLGRMQHSVDRLSSLLNSALHLSHGVLDPSEVHLSPGDVTVVLDRVVSEATPWAEAREIEIRLHIDPPLEALHFDHALVYDVLSCLLRNACRVTPNRGVVDVRGYPLHSAGLHEAGPEPPARDETRWLPGAGYRIDIRDSGPPIPAAQLPGIFDLAADSKGGFDRSEGWLELGMCKLILDAHHGDVSVESGESGTVFSVVLPSLPPPAATT